jgi:hypothetical protein
MGQINFVESLVEYAMCYVSVYHSEVMDCVLENIEDSEKLTVEERQYLSEIVRAMIDKLL